MSTEESNLTNLFIIVAEFTTVSEIKKITTSLEIESISKSACLALKLQTY